MADDLIVTDEALEDPLVLKRLLSDMIERLSNEVNDVINTQQLRLFNEQTKVQLQDEGARISSDMTTLNFKGAGVVASLNNSINRSNVLVTISEEKTFNRPGPLTTLTGVSRWYPTKEFSIKGIRANVGAAPIGNDILIDIKKNDVTILAANMVILDGAFLSTALVIDLAMLTTDYLTVDILQIGRQPTVGYDLVINFDYT